MWQGLRVHQARLQREVRHAIPRGCVAGSQGSHVAAPAMDKDTGLGSGVTVWPGAGSHLLLTAPVFLDPAGA